SSQTGSHYFAAFNLEFDSFLDNIMFAAFIDRVGKYQLTMQKVSAYRPYAESMPPMLREEAFHLAAGVMPLRRWVERAAKGDPLVTMAAMQKAANKWFSRGLEMFGFEKEPFSSAQVNLGLKDRTNADAQQQWIDECAQMLGDLSRRYVRARLPGNTPEEIDAIQQRLAAGETVEGIALGDGYRCRPSPPGPRRARAAPPPLTLHEFRARPADRTVQGAGVRLHLLDWDGDARPDALFLHGGGLTAHTWDVVCDELRDRVRPLALDLRGHGDSEWSPDGHYPLGAHVADLESAMADLALKDFVLVGMSLGGLVALAYAGRHPRTFAALILVESGPEMRRSERLRDFMAADAEADSFDEFVDRAAAFNPLRDREHLRRSLRYALRRTPDGKWTWKYDRRILERGTEDVLPRARALWDAARSVDCPALVIRGGKSDIFLDEDAAERARVLRGEWVRIE